MDILAQLRNPATSVSPYRSLADLCLEAADEIERLRSGKVSPEMAAAGGKALVESLKPWRRHLTIPHYNIPAIDIAKEVYAGMIKCTSIKPGE